MHVVDREPANRAPKPNTSERGQRRGLARGWGWLAVFMLVVGLIPTAIAPAAATQTDDGTNPDAEDGEPDAATYAGTTFGFTLDYDPAEWEIVEEASDGAEDYAVFFNGPGYVTLTASAAYGGDPVACRNDWIRLLRTSAGIEDYRPLQTETGDLVADEEDGFAFAAYAFRSGDGDEFFHVECLVLIPDEATLAIVVESYVDDYTAEIEATKGLLGGLDISAVVLPEPAVTVGGGDQGDAGETPGVALSDAFEDPLAGYLSTTSPDRRLARYAYAEGEYLIETLDDEAGTWQAGVPGQYDDATIAIDARLTGETENRFIIVGCRSSDTAAGPSEYDVTLDPNDGTVSLIRLDEGEATVLAEETRDDGVQLGEATNRIGLSCVGTTIAATVNGEVVLSVEDDTYAAGGFLFGAGVADGEVGTVESHWDNLDVTLDAA